MEKQSMCCQVEIALARSATVSYLQLYTYDRHDTPECVSTDQDIVGLLDVPVQTSMTLCDDPL